MFLLLLFITSFAWAGIITHTDYATQGAISASGQNANENIMVNVLNGNLDYTNFVSTLTTGSFSSLTGTNISTMAITGSTANSGGSTGIIQAGTISTVDLRDNAVFKSSTTHKGNTSFDGNNDLVQQVTITTIGGPVLIIAAGRFNPLSVFSTVTNGVIISRDATSLNTTASGIYNTTTSGGISSLRTVLIDPVPAGTYNYKARYNHPVGDGADTSNIDLIVIELRK